MKLLSRFIGPFDRLIDGEIIMHIMHKHLWRHVIQFIRTVIVYTIPILGTVFLFMFSQTFSEIIGNVPYIIIMTIICLSIFIPLFIRISTIIIDYKYNTLIVTDIRIIEIHYKFIFSREVDSIYIKDIINMCAYRLGFLQTIFQFGELDIKTAAETKDFRVQHLPHPNKVIQIIQNQQLLLRNRKYEIQDTAIPKEQPLPERIKEAFHKKLMGIVNER